MRWQHVVHRTLRLYPTPIVGLSDAHKKSYSESNGWMAHFGAINRWCSTLGWLSWYFDILIHLVSLSKHLPLISLLIASS